MDKPIIMAVDDQATILNLIMSALKEKYDVIPFMSGQAALDFLLEKSVDLILLDYTMPGMMGCDVLRALHANERTRDIPVIFLTASVNDNIEADMLENGAMDYIAKPFSVPVLLARIGLQLELMSYRTSLQQLVEEKTESLRQAYENLKKRDEFTIQMLARVTELRDHNTGDHIQRTTDLVRIIVQDLLDRPHPGYELSPDMAENIVSSAMLHDLGKIGVPDHILQKPGRLTPEEFAVIKTHPGHGARLLSEYIDKLGNDSFMHTACDITLYHHEKWNGEGYPSHCRGEDIPLAARIVALADAYDAITSTRVYKNSLSHAQAAKIIQCDSGTHFDPYLTQVFLRHEREFEKVNRD